jgi:signal transduction histidine kinase
MAARDMLRNWLEKTRDSKLSTRVTVLFAGAFILPWCLYAWLTVTERSEQVARIEHNLASLAAAYAEHATMLMRLGIEVPTDEAVSKPDSSDPMELGDAELTAFRSALNASGVDFSLHRIAAHNGARSGTDIGLDLAPRFDDRDGAISTEVVRRAAGIAAIASMSEDNALREWRARADAGAIALILRSLFVMGVGYFLVQQLRWREAAETELVGAKETAESASRAKSEFLANMSHELRTPLNAILGFSEIIKNRQFGPASERYPDYAGHIFSSGKHLLALINDILNLSKLEAGRFALQEEDIDLAVTAGACMTLVETQAKDSKIRLSVSIDNDNRFIRVDDRRMRQILINLLSNAVKFTPPGGQVHLSSARVNGGLAITVSDSGIGMAAADIPKAMTPFGQVDSKIRRKQEGTGLGLPLARQLVELHGGTFILESKINVGTTVTFVLPPERIIAPPSRLTAVRAVG